MNWIVVRMKWIMLVCGVLTCTMIYPAIAPQAALHSTFGASLDGPLAEIVVRNWGVLVALVGAMLVYGAFNPSVRPLVLTVAGLSKLSFILLVLVYGKQYLGHPVRISIAVDLVMVIAFVLYLIRARRDETAP